MNIRTANNADLLAIVEIYNQAVIAGQKTADISPVILEDRKPWFENHTADKHPLFVAEENNLIIGYCTISPYRPGRMALRHTAEVSYYIHFDHHRRGIASQLLKHAIEMCPSLEIKTLFAIVIDSNAASIRFLEKHGFEKWGYMPGVAEFDGIEAGHLYYGLKMRNANNQIRPIAGNPGSG
jgi:L-amino acid N-acyltransferase YncA